MKLANHTVAQSHQDINGRPLCPSPRLRGPFTQILTHSALDVPPISSTGGINYVLVRLRGGGRAEVDS